MIFSLAAKRTILIGTTLIAFCFFSATSLAAPIQTGKQRTKPNAKKKLSPSEQHEQGIRLYRAGKVADAENAFRAVLEAEPTHIPARYDLGALLVSQGRMRKLSTGLDWC